MNSHTHTEDDMTIYRIPPEREEVFLQYIHRPYEGMIWILDAVTGGTIATALARADFDTLINKYRLQIQQLPIHP
jgi:hypothetical protein